MSSPGVASRIVLYSQVALCALRRSVARAPQRVSCHNEAEEEVVADAQEDHTAVLPPVARLEAEQFQVEVALAVDMVRADTVVDLQQSSHMGGRYSDGYIWGLPRSGCVPLLQC